ncbi:hypothetical protein C2U68_09480 [Methylomonas koyamae]|nr:hypothetical protein C2U68_09480 [Methylomonas koyamae]
MQTSTTDDGLRQPNQTRRGKICSISLSVNTIGLACMPPPVGDDVGEVGCGDAVDAAAVKWQGIAGLLIVQNRRTFSR